MRENKKQKTLEFICLISFGCGVFCFSLVFLLRESVLRSVSTTTDDDDCKQQQNKKKNSTQIESVQNSLSIAKLRLNFRQKKKIKENHSHFNVFIISSLHTSIHLLNENILSIKKNKKN